MKKDSQPDRLEKELRQLEICDPDPDLRRTTLAAAREALRASVREPAGKGWWPELGLSAAALLILLVSLPPAPAAHTPGGVAPAVSAPAELRATLGVDAKLARYINSRTVPAGRGPTSSTSRSFNNDPS